jgi:hypothetical protein
MQTDRCGNTCRQKRCAKGSEKEVKIQEFVYIFNTATHSTLHYSLFQNYPSHP